MRQHCIVIGQRVGEEKVRLAKLLRSEITPEEELLWGRLRRSQLNGLHFRRQQIIDGFIADFYCHAALLVVEVDGGSHRDRSAYDAERDHILAARNLRIMRVRNEDVRTDIEGVLARIAAEAGRGSNSPFPSREGGKGG